MLELFAHRDAVGTVVVIVLLAMSVSSWVVLLWKGWLLQRVNRDMVRSTLAFWQAADLQAALIVVEDMDREQLLLPMVQAGLTLPSGNLAAAGDRAQQLTRVLRDALHAALRKLQATIGSTAPFVGLLGTVWGIYHALTGLAGAGQISIDKISGPVGEALIMTAAGLAVAIPAVLGYNILGRFIGRIEADLEGFARDLRELLLTHTP